MHSSLLLINTRSCIIHPRSLRARDITILSPPSYRNPALLGDLMQPYHSPGRYAIGICIYHVPCLLLPRELNLLYLRDFSCINDESDLFHRHLRRANPLHIHPWRQHIRPYTHHNPRPSLRARHNDTLVLSTRHHGPRRRVSEYAHGVHTTNALSD